jgi:ligand-binding sensor domain-containing protein
MGSARTHLLVGRKKPAIPERYAACHAIRGDTSDAAAGYPVKIGMFRVPRWRAILAVVLSLPLLAAAWVFWRASHARQEAAAEVLAKSEFPVRILPVDRVAPAAVESIAASPGFRDLATYKDMIAVSARAGLFLYQRNGALLREYRAGIELPSAELGSLSAGMAAGSAEPELFIATRGEGLLAFNGSRFRQILPSDPGLRIVTSVLVLGSGRVLIGTERQGLLVFDGRRLTPFHPRLKSAHITALAGNDGDLWIGTLADGVFHHRAGQLEELLPALPDPQVLSLAVAHEMVYAGTPLGVVEFRQGQRQRTLADGFFARAMALRGATLQVGTEDEGILDVPLQSRPAPPSAAPLDTGAPPAVLRLANLEGDVYAVAESAIHRYDAASKRWRPVLTAGRSLMADRNVAALALSGGRLWIGYFDRGLDVVDAGLENAVHHEDDALFCINRIVADAEHARTAVATANGLVIFDSGAQPRQAMGRKDGFLSDHITDVAFREGGMVVATPAGLSFVDRSGVRSLYVFHGLVNNHVYTVATRGSQTVAGTLGGLSVLEDDSVRANYTTANSHLKHNWITALARVGDEWFAGTYGAGVLRLDSSGQWHSFPDLREGLIVNPNAMAVSGGRLYAGSLDRGLFVFDRATGRWTNTTMGLPSKNVTALASGGGYLYAGTDNGLVRIAEGELR